MSARQDDLARIARNRERSAALRAALRNEPDRGAYGQWWYEIARAWDARGDGTMAAAARNTAQTFRHGVRRHAGVPIPESAP